MWYLTSNIDQRLLYVISENNEITIGRSPDIQICNFSILDDPSISRRHATLSLSENSLFIQDLESRYGTFINDKPVEANNKVNVKNGDIIKFGKMNSVWKVVKINLVTCTSTLKGENLSNVRSNLKTLGGILKLEWDNDCTYLTMPAITLTIKVVLALVQGSYIVTTDFWNKCLESVSKNISLPDPKNFTPQVVEATLNKENVSFLPNILRKTLFNKKIFVFFSRRQFEMYKPVLTIGSAIVHLLSESKMTKSMLCEENVVVIQYNIATVNQETQEQKSQIDDVINYLKSKGKRIVADAEIGLAVLYCSTNKYCNPDFKFSSEVIKQTDMQCNKEITVLAQESVDMLSKPQCANKNVVINESLSEENETSKRKLCEDRDDLKENPMKKMAIEPNKNLSESFKRKSDVDNHHEMPSKKMALGSDATEDDFFNFVAPNDVSKDNKNKSENKLNLFKPQKRKADLISNDEDLFNFVENDKSKITDEEISKLRKLENQDASNKPNSAPAKDLSAQDIAAMRGAKLDELKKINQNWNVNPTVQNIKKEVTDDLDDKMNHLDIGSIVVTVKKDLIIKKEPKQIEEQNSPVKNFKKFKKVWPVKMQVTVIPKSSMSMLHETSSMSV